jgi:DNA-binding beta-propeller fold protein YncE
VVVGVPTGLLAFLLVLVCLASSARASDRVYWANDSSPNRISFANLDGSGGGNLSTAGATAGQPRGVALDVAAGRVYWTNPVNNRISFANLDGSGGGGDLNTLGATVNRPNAAAVYPAAGRIYWANEVGDRISFANLDNSGGGDLTTTGATVDVPIGPMVDPGSGRIYWGNANPINVLSFANLDGSGGGNLNTAGATVDNPHGVALDPAAGRIYWANVGLNERISYTNLDGSGGGDLNTTGATVNVPVGVAIDPSARRIYWANRAGNRISFANLDGSGGGDLNTPGATLSGSRSPVLLKAPSGAGAPAITGGPSTGSVLTCSQGSWAPDQLGSWLYRTPQRLSYSWTRNGATIPGADTNTHTATTAGDYRCTVTATNPAGSTTQTSPPHAIAQPSPPSAGSPSAGSASRTRTSTAKPAFGPKTLITLIVAARRIRGSGPIKVVIRNENGFRVSGKLSAKTNKRVSASRGRRAVITGKAFEVGAEARRIVALKLTKPLRRLFKRTRKLSLRLAAKVKDPAGNTRILRKNVSLRLKKTA